MPLMDLKAWRQLASGTDVPPNYMGFEAPPPKPEDVQLADKVYKALAFMRHNLQYLDRILKETTAYSNIHEELTNVSRVLDTLDKVPDAYAFKVSATAFRLWPDPTRVNAVSRHAGQPPAVFAMADVLTKDEIRRLQEETLRFPYPCAPSDMRAEIVLGTTPVELSRGLLSKHDAHLWLSCYSRYREPGDEEPTDDDFNTHPAFWYLEHRLGIPEEELVIRGGDILWQREGLDWLTNVWRNPARRAALLRPRVTFGPHGEEIRGNYLSRIDELAAEDLVPSVQRSFQNAMERIAEEEDGGYFEPDQELTPLPHWWVKTPYATFLQTPRSLAQEGRDMHHCSGQYAYRVHTEQSAVISIKTPSCRSTVEVDPDTLEVNQHVGDGNAPPKADCVAVLNRLLREWRRRK